MNHAQTNLPLFSFGTLMDPDVLTVVSAQPLAELAIIPATVSGYSQFKVLTENFPVMVSAPDAVTQGVLITGLTVKALQRILFFEGDEYELAEIVVATGDKKSLVCQYFRDNAVYQLDTVQWSFDRWVVNDKAEFLRRTETYMSNFGVMSATEADKFW